VWLKFFAHVNEKPSRGLCVFRPWNTFFHIFGSDLPVSSTVAPLLHHPIKMQDPFLIYYVPKKILFSKYFWVGWRTLHNLNRSRQRPWCFWPLWYIKQRGFELPELANKFAYLRARAPINPCRISCLQAMFACLRDFTEKSYTIWSTTSQIDDAEIINIG
jgi:hypothetical protein